MSIVTALILTTIETVLNALLLMKFWQWFIVPIGLDAISFKQSIGLIIFLAAFRFRISELRYVEKLSLEERIAIFVTFQLVFWIIGFGVYLLLKWF